MSKLSKAFLGCHLIQYANNTDDRLDVYSLQPLVEITNRHGGKFLGSSNGTRFGHRLIIPATHVGVIDLYDQDDPILIHGFSFADTNPKTFNVVSVDDYYIIFKRYTTNFNLIISEHKSFSDQYRADTV